MSILGRSATWVRFSLGKGVLVIAFESVELRKLCESAEQARQAFGILVSQELLGRLADIRAATNIFDVVVGNLREAANPAFAGCMQLDLADGYYLYFVDNQPSVARLGEGCADWKAVTRVRILGIAN